MKLSELMIILSRFSPNISGRKNAENLFPNEESVKDEEDKNEADTNNQKKEPEEQKDESNIENNINFYKYMYTEPSSGQKLLVSILFGLLFAIIASPIFHEMLNHISVYLGGIKLTEGKGLNLPGLILCTIIFTIIVRIILW